jgi:plastocyanin
MVMMMLAVALLLAAGAQALEMRSQPLNASGPVEVRIVSTEFKFTPSKVRVPPGRAVTLIFDNSGAETEHALHVPAFDFRLEAKGGEITQKTTVFDTPGEYEFFCDLPGPRLCGHEGHVDHRWFLETIGRFSLRTEETQRMTRGRC